MRPKWRSGTLEAIQSAQDNHWHALATLKFRPCLKKYFLDAFSVYEGVANVCCKHSDVVQSSNEKEDAYRFARDDGRIGVEIVWWAGQIYTGNITSLASKVNFYVKDKITVDLSLINRPVIDKFEGNACWCHLLFNFTPPILCPVFRSTEMASYQLWGNVLGFDSIDNTVASFGRDIISPGEGMLF